MLSKKFRKAMSAILIGIMAFSLSGCGSSNVATNQNTTSNNSFKPGTYTATAKGNNGDVKIEVVFGDSSIESISIAEHVETAGLGDTAMEKLALQIVDGQTLKVDVVTGATNSSNALLTAVEDCVTQAGGNVEALKSVEVSKDDTPVEYSEESLEADYVVIGGGPSGMASAVEAAEAGLSVVVFEKIGTTGGAANYGMGPLALNSEIQAEQGESISVDEAYDMFMEYTHYRVDGDLVRKYFDMSSDTIEWMEGFGVEFTEAARYFDKSYPSWHIVKSDDGKVGGGVAATMMRRLTEQAEKLGVKVYLNTPVKEIKTENGTISGVMAESETDGIRYSVNSKSVLVATGGFGNNVDMIQDELGYTWGEDYFGMRFEGHEGDGIKMAEAVGAGESDVNIEMIFNIYANGGPNIPHDVMLMMRQPGLLVNKEGNRFFNEEQVQNTTYCGNSLVQQTGNTGYMILSENIVNKYVENGVDFTSKVYNVSDFSTFKDSVDSLIAEKSPSVFKADSIEELAEYMGINKDNLVKTLAEYNEICKSGNDPLGKSTEFLTEMSSGPYYVAQYFPGSYGTLGGIKVNSNLEVVDSSNAAIPGLYSAGTDSCSIFGDSYMFLLPGNTMGYSLNSGRIAAQSAIEYVNGLK